MANVSLRLMLAFMFAALVLNVSNYLFIRIYHTAHHNPYKTESTKRSEKYGIDPRFWSAVISCDETSYPSTQQKTNSSEVDSTTSAIEMENCPELPLDLGPEVQARSQNHISTNFQYPTVVKAGGIYKPINCKSLQSVAIIIAYRGCKNQLHTFLNILHLFLIKQQLDYQIFVVEQTNKTQAFNRGKLLNVGFTEATRYRKGGFRCIIFHEPHIVPVDSRNLYRCSWYPRQLAAFVERPIKPPYLPLLGGAIAFTPEQFLKLNGFSNVYWGNDADYYDLYNRINASNYYLENTVPLIGKYKTIRKGLGLWTKSEYLSTPSPLYLLDGLTSLSYTVDSLELKRLFTYLQVSIDAVVETETRAKMYDKLLNPVIYQTTQLTSQDDMNK